MESIELCDVEVNGTSEAVAWGRAIVEALEGLDAVLVDNDGTSGDEANWSELEQYLGRRGVTLAYDHDAGYPVATRD